MHSTSVPVAAPVNYSVPSGVSFALRAVAASGGLVFLIGLFVAPREAWAGYLSGFFLFVEMGLAGAFFLAILKIAGARWSTALRRIPEAMASTIPVGALLGLVLLGGVPTLYEWSHPGITETDWLLAGKAPYLNVPFFILRMAIFFGLWIFLSRRMIRASREQDTGEGRPEARRMLSASLAFIPIFAITFSLASIDWLKSLEPHWFSTIYGLVTLSSLGSLGLAVCMVLAIQLRRGPLRKIVRADHLDDLGKLGIAFTLFWGYIWYCQYMLIWYTDMPEETPYYALRAQGGWQMMTYLSIALNWAIPFFALMPKAVRRSPRHMLQIAYVMIAGQVINMIVLVAPSQMGPEPSFSLFVIAPIIGAIALFFLMALRGLAAAPLVPMRDPDLAQSMSYHC